MHSTIRKHACGEDWFVAKKTHLVPEVEPDVVVVEQTVAHVVDLRTTQAHSRTRTHTAATAVHALTIGLRSGHRPGSSPSSRTPGSSLDSRMHHAVKAAALGAWCAWCCAFATAFCPFAPFLFFIPNVLSSTNFLLAFAACARERERECEARREEE